MGEGEGEDGREGERQRKTEGDKESERKRGRWGGARHHWVADFQVDGQAPSVSRHLNPTELPKPQLSLYFSTTQCFVSECLVECVAGERRQGFYIYRPNIFLSAFHNIS